MRHSSVYISAISLVALWLSPLGGCVGAQVSVEAGPAIGYYSATPAERDDGRNAPSQFSGRVYGGDVMVWFPHRLGIRADYYVANKERLEVPNPGGFQPALSGRVRVGSLLATYDLSPSHPHLLWIAAGPGYVGHDGEAFQYSGNPSNLAGALGVGSTLPVGNAFRLILGGSAFLYRYTGVFGVVGGPPGHVEPDYHVRRFQHDGVIHAAIAWNGR